MKITRLFEDISGNRGFCLEMWVFFIKISFIFEDFFREIEAFSTIARLFKYIFSGIEAFFAMSLWP
jgi:hypothetical protein